MIPEHRYSAIRHAFYEIAIYCLVQNQNTLLGLQRLKHMKEIIDRIDVSNDLDEVNYNHRFFKNVLESAIIESTNGIFTAYYSNYSSYLTKDFKTLIQAKKQIDKWLK